MKTFLAYFGPLFTFILAGFDRLRFRGDSRPLNNARGVDSYLYRQQIKYVDFPKHAQSLTDTFCHDTEKQAKVQGVPIQHLNSPKIDKEMIKCLHYGSVQKFHNEPEALATVISCEIPSLALRAYKDCSGTYEMGI